MRICVSGLCSLYKMQYRVSITVKTEATHFKGNPEDGKTERKLRGLVLLSYSFVIRRYI